MKKPDDEAPICPAILKIFSLFYVIPIKMWYYAVVKGAQAPVL